ncbi:hypothetical protein LTR10_020608 [Elasticomyces elasticus]|uniref:Zn(2)-C6 fungal-type domain-containing protein n=1 Tax=Exophiala sideris TaxID=1016849 RepID=A0ABR0JQA8_9EURO|nr:hypothetical protein LTR10_020608 [Elasticomyces elasticus]KAK5038363.1 hypothetical protein LTS07_001833 [Exophiala sideris]KAK5044347.1 hypothetical protein LTR13_000703 [Exophiala sideris]KAK5067847.1 hypothetical protein LTR69_001836 [Exophiala sideris]KAK5183911.1 hypothetical protein LTR44_003416 [Eurotiomycetes sp. CCFEE 6388]
MPNKKKSKSRGNAPPPPPKTVDCSACHQPIIIPRSCRHGKKLINCQGTDCSTAHITAHKDPETEFFLDSNRAQKAIMLNDWIPKTIRVIEKNRGKEMKYLNGMPKAEFLQNIRGVSIKGKEIIVVELDAIQAGVLSFEASIYDDEESVTEGEDRLTPPEDD